MKKIFTLDQLLVAFISAVGWGIGIIIPQRLGCGQGVSLVVCTVCGLSFDWLAGKIMQLKRIQARPSNKLWVGLAFAAFFVLCELAVRAYTGSSLISSLAEQYFYIVLLPFAGFILSLAVSHFKVKRLEKRFGRGEQGYHADEKAREYYESLNGTNCEISGEYDKDCAVTVENGTFVGFRDGKIVKFLGIPYAEAKRFEAPAETEKSGGVYEAKYFGPSPIQPISDRNPIGWHNQGENCLTLNVFYKNTKKPTGKKAVIAMPMCGDYVSGSAVSPVIDATEFLKDHDNIICVTFTYRLGVPGFTDLSGIPGGEAYPHSAELGLLDSLEALKWIRNNISAFGGDEENISVLGVGIGGMITTILSASEKAKGLYKKAFIVSNYAGLISPGSKKKEEAKMLADYFGCRCASDLLELSADDIRRYTVDPDAIITGPSYGTELLPVRLLDAYSSGAAKDIDMIFCQAGEDFGEWILTEGLEDTEEYIDIILNQMKADASEEYTAFLKTILDEKLAEGMDEKQGKRYLVENLLFRATTLAIVKAQLEGGGKARLFYSDTTADVELFSMNSIYELLCFLENKAVAEELGSVFVNGIEKIAGQMLNNYALDGDPSVKPNDLAKVSPIPWPYFDGSDETVMAVTDMGFKLGKSSFVSEAERFLPYVKV